MPLGGTHPARRLVSPVALGSVTGPVGVASLRTPCDPLAMTVPGRYGRVSASSSTEVTS